MAATTDPPPLTLDSPVSEITGVGPARVRQLAALGVHTAGDLLDYFPRTYQYESSEKPAADLVPEQIQTIRGTVTAVDYIASRPRPRFEATLQDGEHAVSLVWFNGAYLRRQIHPGLTLRVRGKVRFFRGIPQMSNPKWERVDEQTPAIEQATFRPIYPASGDLPSDRIVPLVAAAAPPLLPLVEEWVDEDLLRRRALIERREAYRLIHQPANLREAAAARRRLMYDELLLLQVGLAISKRLRDGKLTAPIMHLDKLLDERIKRRLAFQLTTAQQRAAWEVARDLQSGSPMNRLLQGDVGSGKTSVALYAMLLSVANKLQSAMLAPTEVLAEQHFINIAAALEGSSVKVELFSSRTRRTKRGDHLRALADGSVHIAVGTQALLSGDVEFANLGLVVVDEQHKLGVRQRATLRSKGLSPHYLVMTATPIPRTLALSYFADFDVSILDELPPGRTPILTRWIRPEAADRAHAFIRDEVRKGRQCYVVLPQIEDNGLDDAKGVRSEYERLGKGPLAGLRLAMLHGQMPADEKQAVMRAFRAGEADVLVSTTVIEVGVDVPNATVMLIDSAERFGLSQLHQLRGRVGRGSEQSHCLLLSGATTEEATVRLNAMCRTSDGFEIAETDLKLRGPGDFLGTRQHGLPSLKLADITQELDLLHEAREDALLLLQRDPQLRDPRHAALRRSVIAQFGDALPLGQVG
jgi:ATP-dependent DNA helicase RecG